MSNTDLPPSSAGPRLESMRPEQTTLVDEAERLSVPIVVGAPRNRALLTVLTGPQRGSVHRLSGTGGTLGRSDQADACISDPSLSRIHARVSRDGDVFFVEDAGSTNGTFVDEQAVLGRIELLPGARIRLGRRTIVRFTLHDELEEAAALSVHQAALHDRLTGVYNRGVFDDRLASEFAFAKRHGSALSVLLFDIDHFKNFNDTYGHLTGDAVLVTTAKRVQETIRTEDVLARYGGEEFVVIARSTPADKSRILGERIRRAIERIRMTWGDGVLQVTATVGVATLADSAAADSGEELLEAADAALYQGKQQGRNRVVHAEDVLA